MAGITMRIDDWKAAFERLAPRERVMVGALAAVLLLGVVGGFAWWITGALDEIEEQNTKTRAALADLERYQGPYLKERRRTAALETRLAHANLELNTYVEKAASSVGVTISESGETSAVPGDGFVQRGVEIKLNKVSIAQLLALIKKLEEEQAHIVQVTRLGVSTRWNRNQELDVELVVSTYAKGTEGTGTPGSKTPRSRPGRS